MGRVGQWANSYLEREGLARLTISILVITTAGCLAYTWGYAEGVHNSKEVILPSKQALPVVFPGGDASYHEAITHHLPGSATGSTSSSSDSNATSDSSNDQQQQAAPVPGAKKKHRRPRPNAGLTAAAAEEMPAGEQPAASDSQGSSDGLLPDGRHRRRLLLQRWRRQ